MKQLALPLETRPALDREDFIVAPANCDAVAFIDSFPTWSAPAAALFGPAGSGKSHLAAAWAKRADATIVSAQSLDELALQGISSAVVIEDVDRAVPLGARDAAIFALWERGVFALFTGRSNPSQWPVVMPDLASRYRALLSFALVEPDEALLTALARKLFADRQLAVPDPVIGQMMRMLERSPAAIRDFVARADRKALAERRSISTALVRELLDDGGQSDLTA